MQIHEALDCLEDLEKGLSHMYLGLSKRFSHDRKIADLFAQLSEDELSHKDIVVFQRRQIPRSDHTPVDINVDEITDILGRIDEIIASTEDIAGALRVAFEIETSSAEYHYRTAIEQVNESLAQMVKSLGDADNLHFSKLKSFIETYLTQQQLYETFGAAVKAFQLSATAPANALTGPPRVSLESAKSINEMFQQVRQRNHYQTFGLEDFAPAQGVQQAYRRIMKQWHPDTFGPLPESLSVKLNEIISHINDAYRTLSDETLKKAYDQALRSGQNSGLSIIPLDEEKAVQGWAKLSNRNFQGAVRDFQEALRIRAKPKYYWYLATALRGIRQYDDAVKAIEVALRSNPRKVEFLIESAMIDTMRKQYKSARETFVLVLKLSPGNRKATEALQRLPSTDSGSFLSRLFGR